MAMLSILALYNWDNTLFNDLNVPEGMDKNNIIDNILFECAELSLLYTDPAFMKRAIKQWSDKEQNVWAKLFATENFDYNPIWNVDGTVTEKETVERDRTNDIDRSTATAEAAHEATSDDVDQTTTDSVTGYNSTAWQDHTKSVVDSDRDITTNSTRNISGTDNVDEAESEDVERNLETRRTGNIGVTTTQQMIREERDVALFNTIEFITNSFKKRFCVMVY